MFTKGSYVQNLSSNQNEGDWFSLCHVFPFVFLLNRIYDKKKKKSSCFLSSFISVDIKGINPHWLRVKTLSAVGPPWPKAKKCKALHWCLLERRRMSREKWNQWTPYLRASTASMYMSNTLSCPLDLVLTVLKALKSLSYQRDPFLCSLWGLYLVLKGKFCKKENVYKFFLHWNCVTVQKPLH